MPYQQKGPRQGDILFVARDKGSFTGQRVAPVKGKLVVAEGEATGHHHSVKATPHVAMFDNGIDTIISVAEGAATLTHQEHIALDIPVGDYDVVRQRHVVPGSEHLVRTVVD